MEEVVCGKCCGIGTFQCDGCNVAGEVEASMPIAAVQGITRPCPECGGSGKITCLRCLGEGYVTRFRSKSEGGKDMKQSYELKIDAYSHIIPSKYKEALYKIAPKHHDQYVAPFPPLYDLERRFRIMDQFEPIRQVLTMGWPAIEDVADPVQAVELAKLANDGMAELIQKYPERFVAAIAILPMNNIDAALKETDRAINDLRFRGVYVYTPAANKSLDSTEFMPLYEKMSQYNLPIYIHPMRTPDHPDYQFEDKSKYMIHGILGWPYETTVAMARLVFSGILEKYLNLKFVTHHCGGMVPYYAQRIVELSQGAEFRGFKELPRLNKTPIDYFRMFYNDTALYGNPAALMCGCAFFGADHLLFGTDMPLGTTDFGYRNYRETIGAIEQMNITDAERKKIFEDNARSLMRLLA